MWFEHGRSQPGTAVYDDHEGNISDHVFLRCRRVAKPSTTRRPHRTPRRAQPDGDVDPGSRFQTTLDIHVLPQRLLARRDDQAMTEEETERLLRCPRCGHEFPQPEPPIFSAFTGFMDGE